MERYAPGINGHDKALEALQASEERFRLVFEHAPIGMLISDLKGRFTRVNKAMAEMLGYSVKQLAAMGFQEITHPDDLNKDKFLIGQLMRGKKTRVAMEKRYVRSDGEIIYVMLHGSFVRNDGGQLAYFIGQIVDITERKNHEQTMRHLAYHDQLTGLSNRMLFRDRLALALNQARDRQEMLAVIFLDLDRFKTINDTLGHYVGDQALKIIAGRIRDSLRASDMVARVGGDEFTVMLPNITHEQDVLKVLQKLIAALEEPFTLKNREFVVSASVGIALYPRDGYEIDTLLEVADQAMYAAKQQKGLES